MGFDFNNNNNSSNQNGGFGSSFNSENGFGKGTGFDFGNNQNQGSGFGSANNQSSGTGFNINNDFRNGSDFTTGNGFDIVPTNKNTANKTKNVIRKPKTSTNIPFGLIAKISAMIILVVLVIVYWEVIVDAAIQLFVLAVLLLVAFIIFKILIYNKIRDIFRW